MAAPVLTEIPAEVTLRQSELANPRFTPRELRMLKDQTGTTMSQLFADDKSDEKFVVFGWLKLRRMGHDVSLDDMDDVVLSFDFNDAAVDPTNGQPPAISPPSAATGA